MKVTQEIKTAFKYVKQFYPEITIVVFNKEGRWQYMDEDFGSPTFNKDVDVSILEEAIDSYMGTLPFVFEPTEKDLQ